MAHIVAQTIASRARTVLNDNDAVRWQDAELLDWINAAEAAIVAIEPVAYVVTESFVLAAGTKQLLPSEGVALVDITRNMGTTGTVPGTAVNSIERKTMDSLKADWHSDTASAVVDVFMQDQRDPTKFYVYPPQPASGFGYVEVEYSKMPPQITSMTGALNLRELYQEAILNYLLFRSFSKDSKDGDKSLAISYYEAFIGTLGARAQGDATIDSSEG